ncbi:hypothetical protein V8G54_028992 [Vigna mungo]|uniref:Pentatricopeptide repeat-containing protein n=1 Tax=Vigna mungo TaxID=3915 RepID=A0AAQ3MTJ2_VIGMU
MLCALGKMISILARTDVAHPFGLKRMYSGNPFRSPIRYKMRKFDPWLVFFKREWESNWPFLVGFAVTGTVITKFSLGLTGKSPHQSLSVFEKEEGGTCDYVTYNAMIDGFASEDAFLMFRDMQKGCFGPTEVTFAQAIKMGLIGCVVVNNAMLTMYSGFMRDVVSWNIMVSTLLQENLEEEAILSYLKLRREGIELDEFTYGSLLFATDSLQVVDMIHSLVKIEVLNVLVSAYCRHRKMKMLAIQSGEYRQLSDMEFTGLF